MEQLRTFIAVDIKPENDLLQSWDDLKANLCQDKIKWVDNELMHLTLFFLGDTPEVKINGLMQSIDGSLFSIKSFSLIIKGLGCFGNPLSPKVIWAGIEISNNLLKLKECINSAVIPLGFNEEEREFKPHLTLGRVKEMKPSGKFKNSIENYKTKVFQESKVTNVVLYQSILRQNGPIYKPLRIFKLPSL